MSPTPIGRWAPWLAALLVAAAVGGVVIWKHHRTARDPYAAYCEVVAEQRAQISSATSQGATTGLIAALPSFELLSAKAPADVADDWSVVVEAMVANGLLDWRGVARVMSENPARIGGLAGHGRPVAAGEPANLVLIDPDARWTVRPAELASLSRNTPFAGRELPVRVVATFLRGTATVRDGIVQESSGAAALAGATW